jgi:hypothetical protein
MVMRFMGGGVGHKATNASTQEFAREARNMPTNPNNDLLQDENQGKDKDEEAGDSEEEDYGYVVESEVEEGNGEDEEDEDLGGEDGEEPWEMDDVQAEGFDHL